PSSLLIASPPFTTSIKLLCSKVDASSSRAAGRSWSRAAAFMQNSTLPGNSTHEQCRRGPQSRKRLVGASDPAECRFWPGVLLRNGASVSFYENEGGACSPLRQSRLRLRRVFFCPRA